MDMMSALTLCASDSLFYDLACVHKKCLYINFVIIIMCCWLVDEMARELFLASFAEAKKVRP